MEADNFIAKLKANGTETDLTDIRFIYDNFKKIISDLPEKRRDIFSLNVLCIICRNLEKAPSWCTKINNTELAQFTMHCWSETSALEPTDNIKLLACLYHIHKHLTKQKPLKPDIYLKLSHIPFTSSRPMLQDYGKTYWNIIVDRITYIDKLKSQNVTITKLLQMLLDDIIKLINIYNLTEFCMERLMYLVKKMYLTYNDYPKELDRFYGLIFESISKKDVVCLTKLTDKESLNLCMKLNECIYVVIENASKINFTTTINDVVKTCMTLMSYNKKVERCMGVIQKFCTVFTELNGKADILKIVLENCEDIQKDGLKEYIYTIYPYLNQLLRILIEFFCRNSQKFVWKDNFDVPTQKYVLKLMSYLIQKSYKCKQLSKCDNCCITTGLHDALRTSLLIKNFITVPLSENIDISTLLPYIQHVVTQQKCVLEELNKQKCVNHEKCHRKYQTDLHNAAIALNRDIYFKYSLHFFHTYINNEIHTYKCPKNISRALYNKSIRELDSKNYYQAIKDGFLSYILGDSLKNDKYINLIMDVKAKALKKEDLDGEIDLQLVTVLDVAEMFIEDESYGCMRSFLENVGFCELLVYEFEMYAKLWPSAAPISGIWRSLYKLMTNNYDWIKVDKEMVANSVYSIIMKTPNIVRSIHHKEIRDVIEKLLEKLRNEKKSTDEKIIYASLLFLKTEFDLVEASTKYGWKTTELSSNPDEMQAIRTITHEYHCLRSSLTAVSVWMDVKTHMDSASRSLLQQGLALAAALVELLLLHCRLAEALQMALVCCQLALHVGDGPIYISNASIILQHTRKQSQFISNMIERAVKYSREYIKNDIYIEIILNFTTDVAIYYNRIGMQKRAAVCLQRVQFQILDSIETKPYLNLEMAIGRVLEAQTEICADNSGFSMLSSVNDTQRHYLASCNSESKWLERRLRSLRIKRQTISATSAATLASRSLALSRRARTTAAVALHVATAPMQAELFARIVDTDKYEDAQYKIDNRIKHILGLQTSESNSAPQHNSKPLLFTPKQNLEVMLENNIYRKPSSPKEIKIAAFKLPPFLTHDSCQCHACRTPSCYVTVCKMAALEASMYFRAKEYEIASNYFTGAEDTLKMSQIKLKIYFDTYKNTYDPAIIDIVKDIHDIEMKYIEFDLLVERTFFEIAVNGVPDDFIVKINDLLKEFTPNKYSMNEYYNLVTASAVIKLNINKITIKEDLEYTKSPIHYKEPPKTPEIKPKNPPKIVKIIVNDDELPKLKRKPIKFELDDEDSDVFKKPTETPKVEPSLSKEFFTPMETPEQYFTPQTSVRTYAKKSLLKGIAKNLENDFGTPKCKETPAKSVKRPTRSTRLRSDKENK